jgi:carboxylate-amine ligase
MFPRCGVPDPYDGWDGFEQYVRFLYEARSIDEHTQIWWSVRPHLAFPTVEIRICDAQPDLGEARALAALCYALTARIARAVDEGEPLPSFPHRLIEENLWRAIRYGLSGEFRSLTEVKVAHPRAPRAARRMGPAGRRGAQVRLAPGDPVRQRGGAADREACSGSHLEEIYAEQVRPMEPVGG